VVLRQDIARKIVLAATLLSIMVLGWMSMGRALHAGDVSTALYIVPVNITNSGSVDLDDVQAAFTISGASLIDGNFIEADALNALVHKGNVDVPGMPATGAIQVEGAVQQDGEVYTEYTTAAQNTTLNDLPLLPPAPAVGDAWYFGCDNPCRILTSDVDTVGAGTWTITYEYWDGREFTALSNVDDRTNGWTTLGKNSTTWDMPTDWATRTTTGTTVSSYWGRARVSDFTSITTQPLGSRQQYENGQWWVWVEDLDVNNQEQVTLHLGGSTDLTSAHQTFPGTDGIITGDAPGLELGSAYSLAMEGRLNFSAAGSGTYVLNKTGAITVNVSGSAVSPAIGTALTGETSSSGNVTGITVPATGTQRIIVASDGVSGAATWVGATGGFASYEPQAITDTANNLTWANNSGIDYFEWVRVDTAEATVFDFDTNYSNFTTGTLTNTQAYTGALGLAN